MSILVPELLGTLGNLITDAMLDYRLDAGAKVHGTIINAGMWTFA